MPIFPSGSLNTTALTVADVYVQIIPPQFLINGVPSNILALVGTATWGPVNSPQIAGNQGQFSAIFGSLQNRTYDMGTHAAIAFQQGATAVMGVRVTDGTDTAATVDDNATPDITFTSKYTGTFGNGIKVTLANGSAASSYQVKIAAPGLSPEIFDNITGTGNALWVAMADAINNGNAQRGPSDIIVATAGAGTASPTIGTLSLSGGTDGATTISGTVLEGSDTYPRTGMYALRGKGASIAVLCDLTDATTWADQVTFGESEGIYMVTAGASGQTPSVGATAKATAAVDSYALKVMLGDWVYWNDTVNNVPQRLVSPAAFAAGKLAALSPEQSSLNKQMNSIVGTQKSKTGVPYTSADIEVLAAAGIDVICNPVPGGSYFGCRTGRNSSSNAVIHGDNYSRMTNYLATTLNSSMGYYVGKLNSATTQRQAKVTLDSFLQNLTDQGMIGSSDGSTPYAVEIDAANNPQSRVALGYLQADVQVKYLSIIEYFLINLEAGQSVQITKSGTSYAI